MTAEQISIFVKIKFGQCIRNLKIITIEPFLFLFILGYHIRLVTFQSLLSDRGCRNALNYSDVVCDNIAKYDIEQGNALKYGNNLFVGCVLLATIPAFILSIFIGPWSDKYGRKVPLIVATTGVLIDNICSAIVSSRVDAHPLFFMGSQFLSGISGGLIVAMSQTYSYLSDITTERTRPTRFAILEFFFILATPAGTFLGGQIIELGGYLAVMSAAPCAFGCALLWAIFVLKETKTLDPEITKMQMVRDLFKVDNLKDSFKTCTKARPGNLRLQIWLLVYLSCSVMVINMGSLIIGFPYASKMFKWEVTEYANTITVFYIFYACAIVSVVPMLSKRFMLHEAAFGLIGTFSLMSKMVNMAVSFKQELIYYAWFCGALHSCCGIAIRSRMSKLVSKQELGEGYSKNVLRNLKLTMFGVFVNCFWICAFIILRLAYASFKWGDIFKSWADKLGIYSVLIQSTFRTKELFLYNKNTNFVHESTTYSWFTKSNPMVPLELTGDDDTNGLGNYSRGEDVISELVFSERLSASKTSSEMASSRLL